MSNYSARTKPIAVGIVTIVENRDSFNESIFNNLVIPQPINQLYIRRVDGSDTKNTAFTGFIVDTPNAGLPIDTDELTSIIPEISGFPIFEYINPDYP